MSPKSIVDGYRSAWESKDFPTARTFLADRLDFVGPINTFDNADDYIEAIKGLFQIVTGTETKHELVDGNDVAIFYDLQTVVAGAAPIAEWYRVEGDKITQIRSFSTHGRSPRRPCSACHKACCHAALSG